MRASTDCSGAATGCRRQPARDVFEFSGRVIDFDNLELSVGDRKLQLTLMEANLLRYLIAREGQVASRQKLLEEVWGVREDTDTRAIDNFVVRLRRYIEDDPAQPKHLLTVRGVGYRFVARPGALNVTASDRRRRPPVRRARSLWRD